MIPAGRIGLALLLALVAGCSGSPTAPDGSVPAGGWGGDHVTLTVGATKAAVEFDCAHGSLPAPITLNHGQFDVAGVFVPEHGGPVQLGEVLPELPARYLGTVNHGQMTLQVHLTDGTPDLGPYALTLGAAGRVLKCL